jgi:hypothetical protein
VPSDFQTTQVTPSVAWTPLSLRGPPDLVFARIPSSATLKLYLGIGHIAIEQSRDLRGGEARGARAHARIVGADLWIE